MKMDEFAYAGVKNFAVVSLKIQKCMSRPKGHHFRMIPTPVERFVYILKGSVLFDIGSEVIEAEQRDVVYFPRNTEYRSDWLSESNFIVIDISLCGADDKEINFGDEPAVLFHDEFGVYDGLLKDLVNKKDQNDPFNWLEQTSICLKLLCEMARDTNQTKSAEKQSRIRKSLIYLENNFAEDFSMEDLAKLSYFSLARFRNLFFECKGMSPLDYRNTLRIRRAAELLKSGEYSISKVAEQVGIPDVKYFGKLFKRYIGTSPGNFKKKKYD